MISTVTCYTCGKEASWNVNDEQSSYYELHHKWRTGSCSFCKQCRPVIDNFFHFCSLDCLIDFVAREKDKEDNKKVNNED